MLTYSRMPATGVAVVTAILVWLCLTWSAASCTGDGTPGQSTDAQGVESSPDAVTDGGSPTQSTDAGVGPDVISTDVRGSEEMRVLFIGNSYTEVNGLPAVVANLSRSAQSPVRFTVAQHTPGGQSWLGHNNDPAVDELIQQGWDFVVLQDQSTRPFDQWRNVSGEFLALDDKVRAAGGTTVLFMTWARAAAPATRFSQNIDVHRYYEINADASGALLAPVGRAWERALRDPSVRLHSEVDGSHPNIEGTYLAACVIYSTLTGESPIGLGTVDFSIDAERARDLQQAAADAIAARYRPPPPPLLGSWPLANTESGNDLLASDALILGDLIGPDSVAGSGTQFGGARYAAGLYFPGFAPTTLTLSFYAHRPDWSVPTDQVEYILSMGDNYRIYQEDNALNVKLYRRHWDWPHEPTIVYPVDELADGWHHFALTYDGTTHALWVDGSQVASSETIGYLGIGPPPRALIMGVPESAVRNNIAVNPLINEFTGGLANIKLFEGALGEAEIQAL